MNTGLGTAAALALVSLAALPATAQTYKFKTENFKKDQTLLYNSNLSGVFVGNYTDTAGNLHCFTLTGAKKVEINDPNGSSTQCYDINKAGTIAGAYNNSSGTSTAFTLSGTTFTDILPTGASSSTAYGLNDTGKVAGTYTDTAGQHGFIYDIKKKTYQTVDATGATATLIISVNNAGQYTVQAFDSNNNITSYMGKGKKLTVVAYPGAATTAVHHINNLGQIALTWRDANAIASGGVDDTVEGAFYTINYPAADQTFNEGISDKQTLAGGYLAHGSTSRQGYKALGKLPK